MKRKIINILMILILTCFSVVFLVSCKSFYEELVTTADGFVYYPRRERINGVYVDCAAIIHLPEKEVVEIPNVLDDGTEVIQLGYWSPGIYLGTSYPLKAYEVKKIIISKSFVFSGKMEVPDLESLVIDNWHREFGDVTNFDYFKNLYDHFNVNSNDLRLEFIRTSSDAELEAYYAKREFDAIILPSFISDIDSNVFEYFDGTFFMTFSKSDKPVGWSDKWSGSAKEEWDFEDSLYFFYLEGGKEFELLGNSSRNLVFPLNEVIPKPKDPVRDGYRFIGWYTVKAGDDSQSKMYDFYRYHEVPQFLDIYAHWTKNT